MVEARVFRWAGGTVVEEEWCDPRAGSVRVADSWLVVDGCAVNLTMHLERFMKSLAVVDPALDTRAFAAEVIALIPSEGRWFPRIEAIDYGDGVMMRFHLREAPDASTDVSLATAHRDPRTQPSVKGPDLAALGALRRELDVGEAVLVDDGFVAEGAWSSIVWWQNDTLHVVDPIIPRLPSVTEKTIRDHADVIGSSVVSARVRPRDLDGAEVWTLSALHGIRIVTEWRDGPAVHVEPGRVDYWRQQYVNQRRALKLGEVRSQS